MPEYRIFQLDDGGRILGPSKVTACEDDHDAIRQARARIKGGVLEIWEGIRRVGTIMPTGGTPRV